MVYFHLFEHFINCSRDLIENSDDWKSKLFSYESMEPNEMYGKTISFEYEIIDGIRSHKIEFKDKKIHSRLRIEISESKRIYEFDTNWLEKETFLFLMNYILKFIVSFYDFDGCWEFQKSWCKRTFKGLYMDIDEDRPYVFHLDEHPIFGTCIKNESMVYFISAIPGLNRHSHVLIRQLESISR